MSVQQDELEWRKSSTGLSDGGAASILSLTSGLKNDLWPNIPDLDRVAGGTRYKKIFACNLSVIDSLVLPVIWIYKEPINITETIGFGIDNSADDDPAQGNMSEFSAANNVALTSSAADTRVVTVVGLSLAGVPQKEDLTLNGTSEVLSTLTFLTVYACYTTTTNTNTVTVREGTGGTSRGTIPSGKVICWLWLEAPTKAEGLKLINLAPTANYGLWLKQTWVANAGGSRPNADTIAIEES
jgi:hypothetical protein